MSELGDKLALIGLEDRLSDIEKRIKRLEYINSQRAVSQKDDLRGLYPINTFSGTTQDELVELIKKQRYQAAVEALNDLFEYMGQFPDINLADMREWIKNFEEEE